jgi:hypothetical protein
MENMAELQGQEGSKVVPAREETEEDVGEDKTADDCQFQCVLQQSGGRDGEQI